MPNQTDYNNKATSNVVYFRDYIQQSVENDCCCFDVVKFASELDNIVNPCPDHIAIIWNTDPPLQWEKRMESIPSIAIYIGNGNWLIKNLKGDKGEQGIQGIQGIQGLAGTNGTNGTNGRDGRDGETPRHKWDGTKLMFSNPDGSWGELVDLKGEKGDKGDRGLTGLNGTAPAHQWNGYSIRFTNPDGSWGVYKDLRGAKGDTGEAGANGTNGLNGSPPKHEIDTVNGRIRFENPDGSWGNWILLGGASSSNLGIDNITIYTPILPTESDLTVAPIIDRYPYPFYLAKGKLLHITLQIPDINQLEYTSIPSRVAKFWYGGTGDRWFGVGKPSAPNTFFCYYHSNYFDINKMSADTINIGKLGTFFKNMSYLELHSDGQKTLKDFMANSERLAIRTLLDSIRLKFRWGKHDTTDAKKDTILDLNNTYRVTYNLDRFTGELYVRKLFVDIPNFEKIKDKTPILLIDRYRQASYKGKDIDPKTGLEIKKYRKAGFKHHGNSRKGEVQYQIPITSATMLLDEKNFAQHLLFSVKDGITGTKDDFVLVANGTGDKTQNPTRRDPKSADQMAGSSSGYVRLRFRIQWCNTDNMGRNKTFKTSESGLLNVQVVRPFSDKHETGVHKDKRVRLLTYKMI